MIINQPTKFDFEEVAKENLVQSFNLIFKVYDELLEFPGELPPTDFFWEFHKGTLRTCLILVYQAIESLMKAIICETSPLLLIDLPRNSWPTLPSSRDKEFDDFHTLGGENLLTTFCGLNSRIVINDNLINFIEDIRHKRNKAVHGISTSGVTPKFIIQNILNTFTVWFGKDAWHNELRHKILKDPLFGFVDPEYELINSYRYLDFLLEILGKGALSEHLSIDIKARSYICPQCAGVVENQNNQTFGSKWAFLQPNEPDSTSITCVNCQEWYEVIRQDCSSENCRGNVITESITGDYWHCLTCWETQEFRE